jgi:Arc/MetJ-type ribon-helix-helix transcriptional regulator
MDKPATDRIEEQLRSVFPQGAIARVQVLEYGDDPEVNPGETAIRAFIDRAGRPESKEADAETVKAFKESNHEVLMKLRDELPRFIGWIEFWPDGPGKAPRPSAILRIGERTGRPATPEEASEELTAVMTRLGAADLATVDTLITAGIANSRAEVLRWAVGRIRENPAYAQLQDRVHEINELKAQF